MTKPPGAVFRGFIGFTWLMAAAGFFLPGGTVAAEATRLKRLSLEELLDTEFVSLSKKPERRGRAPAAVTIITGDDIRRLGLRSIPDALRLAPGTHVARVDANKWAVGIRGFASRLSRSQLALMDGRSVYTPLFAGIYWEVQDTFLEDIDRIEVIRGPGGTLWGANAVNGVINILTKSARETQGAVLQGGGGTEERGFGAFRYGGRLGEATHFRVYGKYFDRDAGRSPGVGDFDDWSMGRVGFRSDTDLPNGDLLTVQGDLYDGGAGNRTEVASRRTEPFVELRTGDSDLSGGNLLGRWSRTLGTGSRLSLQLYYDRTFRRELNFREQRDTFDVDLQHRLPVLPGHDVVWGLGYRFSADKTGGIGDLPPFFAPDDRDIDVVSGFVQDEITIVPEVLALTVGSKFEHNDFSGFEFQPSGRLLWTPGGSHVVWVSFTRAVRTPSRVEHDLVGDFAAAPQGPTFFRLTRNEGFDPERIFAYEAGYRTEPLEGLFLDLAGFFNRYEDFLSAEAGTPFAENDRIIIPFLLRNGLGGDVYGGEVALDTELAPWWRVRGSYSYLQLEFRTKPGVVADDAATEDSSPHHMVSLWSSMDLPGALEADFWLRYVDSLPAQGVGSYVTFDARLGWRLSEHLELSLVGQNLVETSHLEFGGGAAGNVAVERGGYGELAWRW